MNVVNFAAASRRIEAHAALHEALGPQVVEIEIEAARIPVVSQPTLADLLRECVEFYGISATGQELQ